MEDNFGHRYIGKEVADLIEEETDSSIIEERVIGGGRSAKYVNAQETIKKLNYTFGYLWSHRLIGTPIINKNDIVVYGEMEVVFITGGSEIRISKGQAGGSQIKRYSKDDDSGKHSYQKGDVIDLANDVKAAISDSLKKCASEFGIFLDVYMTPTFSAPRQDRITEEQFNTFYFRARRIGLESEEVAKKWIKEQTGKSLEALTSNELLEQVAVLIKMEKAQKAQ